MKKIQKKLKGHKYEIKNNGNNDDDDYKNDNNNKIVMINGRRRSEFLPIIYKFGSRTTKMHLKAKKLHLYLKFSCNRNFTFLTQKYFGKRFSNDLCLVNENEKQFFQILKIHFFGWKHKIVCHEFLTLPPKLQPKVRYILHVDACWHRVWYVSRVRMLFLLSRSNHLDNLLLAKRFI